MPAEGSDYIKPSIDKVPNEEESMKELLNKLNEYIDSYDQVLPEMDDSLLGDKDYIKNIIMEEGTPDTELPFFQSVFEKILETEKTKKNLLTAIDIRNHLMQDLLKENDKESK